VQIVDGPVPEPRQWAVAGAGALVSFAGIVRPTEEGQAIDGGSPARSHRGDG
jgi:hypothetical protein